jgi:uncharacterized membrane protein
MSNQENAPGAAVPLSKTRLEAFSDGVFSIATTLLVLDIALHPPGSPLKQVLEAWPYYLAYLVSFLTIGGAWLAHTALTDRLARADAVFLRLNLLVLLGVGFLPFPTRLVAEALHDFNGERVFVTMYGLTLLAIRIFGFALDEYAKREHLFNSEPDEVSEQSGRSNLAVLVVYVAAILIGLAAPPVAVAFYFGIAIYLVVPFREIRRLLFHRA